MKFSIHASTPLEWWAKCVHAAEWLEWHCPSTQKDLLAAYELGDGRVMVHVSRTKSGGMTARAWRDNKGKANVHII